jgi:hypothetical protein
MDRLSVTRHRDAPFLLLEDDNWLAPDTLHVLDLLMKSGASQYPLFTMGSHQKSLNFGRMSNTFSVQIWSSTEHNIGMVVTRRFWRLVQQNSACFCNYDDYNWGKSNASKV